MGLGLGFEFYPTCVLATSPNEHLLLSTNFLLSLANQGSSGLQILSPLSKEESLFLKEGKIGAGNAVWGRGEFAELPLAGEYTSAVSWFLHETCRVCTIGHKHHLAVRLPKLRKIRAFICQASHSWSSPVAFSHRAVLHALTKKERNGLGSPEFQT